MVKADAKVLLEKSKKLRELRSVSYEWANRLTTCEINNGIIGLPLVGKEFRKHKTRKRNLTMKTSGNSRHKLTLVQRMRLK